MVQGQNDYGQLGLPVSISGMVPFFPNFMSIDYFKEIKQKVIDVAIGATSICFLTASSTTTGKILTG